MHQIDAFNFKMFFLTGEPSILPDFCSLHGEKREGIEGEEKGWGGGGFTVRNSDETEEKEEDRV